MRRHPAGIRFELRPRSSLRVAAAVAVAAITAAFPASAAQPFSFDRTPGRLPKDVVPLDYSVSIVPDVDALAIAGRESVTLEFRSATATIVFNSLNETLSEVRFDSEPVRSVTSSDEEQMTRVGLVAPAPPGKHVLTFSYVGKIETKPRGLFRQFYTRPDGGRGTLLSTMMESTDARRMFPCWDEPAFRSTFELIVAVPSEWAAIGNMPIATRTVNGGVATIAFQRSPSMPSYLLEFTGGDLSALSDRSGGTLLSVWTDRGRQEDGAAALANARQILSDYNDYFGFPYPLPKLDSLAIPGGYGGGMENWGAITYNDQYLLATPRSTMEDRQRLYAIEAHEIAHQWNGDLVTMGWWDDIWLNESFASWRGAKETDLRNPTWKWWEAQDRAKESAMRADAFAGSHPIEQRVEDELQAQNSFDREITYRKGQAVLRMLEAYMGGDTFRDGVRAYIKTRALSNATSADLWNALADASGKSIAEVASGWIERPGFPVVGVQTQCDSTGHRTITLSQERFLLRGSEKEASRWSIPVRVRSGVAGEPQPLLLVRDGQAAPAGRCGEALSLNPEAIGYYRVRYDAPSLEANLKSFGELPDADKIALLDDEWALVESGREELGSYLALVTRMGDGADMRSWEQIAGPAEGTDARDVFRFVSPSSALAAIESAERGTSGHAAFEAYARALIRPLVERLGWDPRPGETPDVQELRRMLIKDLGLWGDPDVLVEARRRFASFLGDHGAIGPGEQPLILSIVARYADATTFDALHTLAKKAKDETEQQRYFSSLMEVGDPQLAGQAAAIALSDEIPPQARWRWLLPALLSSQHPELSWSTFSKNSEMLLAPHPMAAPTIVADYVPRLFWNCVPLEELEAWIRAHVPEEMSASVARGMERARFNREGKGALVRAADAYLRTHPGAR